MLVGELIDELNEYDSTLPVSMAVVDEDGMEMLVDVDKVALTPEGIELKGES